MSVGGKVIEVIPLPEKVWVNTRERGTGAECAIYVERTPAALAITEGDSLWWQGGFAMWTPKRGVARDAFVDKELRRIGCSGVNRPTPLPVETTPQEEHEPK